MSEERFERLRARMVAEQIESRMVRNARVLAAMRAVPRHRFVPELYINNAYEDRPILIGEDQTISQPYIVALMTQLLGLEGEETVLEVGTGSGYQAAVLAECCRQVFTIERHQILAERSAALLAELGYQNVSVRHGDGSGGWPEKGPFDAIMVTAAAPKVPQPLLEQLAQGGRLVLPVGDWNIQYLQRWERQGPKYEHEVIVPVAFVPLRGAYGWKETDY